jgi:hypothetical protein
LILVGILVLGQLADGFTYSLAHNGIELNPLMAALGESAPTLKFAAAGVVALLAWRLRHHPRTLLWLGVVGWFGALSNFSGFV